MIKKVLLMLIITVLIFCLFPLQYCYALATPHVVVEEEIWLLDKQSGARLFLIPTTYYAKIDNMDEDFYYITFNGVSGKVERNLVSTAGYHTQAGGTMREMSIHSKYSDFKTIALKSSMDSSSKDIIMSVNQSFIFLGQYPLSEMWYCVLYEDQMGYIRASRTTIPDIQIEPFVPEEVDGPPSNNSKNEEKTSFLKNPTFLRVIIIVGLSIPAVLIIILLFKPQKTKRRKYYYEE